MRYKYVKLALKVLDAYETGGKVWPADVQAVRAELERELTILHEAGQRRLHGRRIAQIVRLMQDP